MTTDHDPIPEDRQMGDFTVYTAKVPTDWDNTTSARALAPILNLHGEVLNRLQSWSVADLERLSELKARTIRTERRLFWITTYLVAHLGTAIGLLVARLVARLAT
jgi:hypothetical protein